MPGVVVVSPHFDDAVLSCWSVLDEHRSNACVVTVFGGAPPPGRLWRWDAKPPGALDSATRVRERREENRAALAMTASRRIDLGLLESQYEDAGGGRFDPAVLQPYLLDATVVFASAGIGRDRIHPDHVAVRAAVLRTRPDAVLYSDQPYCTFPRDLDLAPPGDYEREVIALSPDSARRKVAAIACYAGEVERLEALRERLGRPEEEFLYEVFWRPSPARPVT